MKNEYPSGNGSYRAPFGAHDGNAASFGTDTAAKASSGKEAIKEPGAELSLSHSNEDTPDTMPDRSLEDDDDVRLGRNGPPHKRSSDVLSEEDSKWIHRDKLAKIESEELQAAGIILPHSRSRSRPRRDRSQSSYKRLGADSTSRSRRDSTHTLDLKTADAAAAMNGWDDADGPSRPTTGSRIPVPKKSPMALTHPRDDSPEDLDKRIDTGKARSRSNSTTLKALEPSPAFKAQAPKRAGTDATPKKTTPVNGVRKTSAPLTKTIPPEARGKPKPKGKSAGGSSTRPSTRSGERELSVGSTGPKQMEGEPPWMVSAYKPDPRLPPDQQLLPTVARRLAQEKWEQEGKFGSVYDKDFRPLTDEGFLSPPAAVPTSSSDNIVRQEVEGLEERPDEWPLKTPEPKSPASLGRSSTYSTMPKIQDKPPSHSPLTTPRSPQPSQAFPAPAPPPQPSPQPQPQPQPIQITRLPDMEEKQPTNAKAAKKKEGCGCCIVM